MVENTSSSLFVSRRSGSALFLILCFSILQTSALTTDIAEQLEVSGEEDGGDANLFMEVSNSSVLEEERFNTTEHRGFLHGFVESLSVILVTLRIYFQILKIDI